MDQTNKRDLLYEGKAKKVYSTDYENLVIVSYKDDATAFDGKKKGTIEGKGVVNNLMSNRLMQMLEDKGVPTHFIKELSETDALVRKVDIIPLEVIIRNIAAGSFSKRYGIEEGVLLKQPSLEFSLKDDSLGDPLINNYHILSIGNIATMEQIDQISENAFKINEILADYFWDRDIKLVDFKLEFGITSDGDLVLADEISPDTCRFWDVNTNEKLDKDRFRRDLGGEAKAYQEMLSRVSEDKKDKDK